MNVDATQLLENSENTCVSDTLVLKEINREVSMKNEDLENTETQAIAELPEKKSNKLESKKVELSNYCIKLVNPLQFGQTEAFLLPLSVGINKIGRSNTNDICILDSNLSKSHSSIDVKQAEGDEPEVCDIYDVGSLNKIRINGSKVLGIGEKHQLELNDEILFGLISYKFVKMSENERSLQKDKPTKFLDLTAFRKSTSSLQKSNSNGTVKSASLFEIQNTLDDTALIESYNGSDNSVKENNEENENDQYYVADTDPEDDAETSNYVNMSASIHLEMSQSILVNQSAYSNKSRTSFYIPDTMEQSWTDDQEPEEVKENQNDKMLPPEPPKPKIDNQNLNGQNKQKIVDSYPNSNIETVPIVEKLEQNQSDKDQPDKVEKTKITSGKLNGSIQIFESPSSQVSENEIIPDTPTTSQPSECETTDLIDQTTPVIEQFIEATNAIKQNIQDTQNETETFKVTETILIGDKSEISKSPTDKNGSVSSERSVPKVTSLAKVASADTEIKTEDKNGFIASESSIENGTPDKDGEVEVEKKPLNVEVSISEDITKSDKVPKGEEALRDKNLPETNEKPKEEVVSKSEIDSTSRTEEAPKAEEIPKSKSERVTQPEEVVKVEEDPKVDQEPTVEETSKSKEVTKPKELVKVEEDPKLEEASKSEEVTKPGEVVKIEKDPKVEEGPKLEETSEPEERPKTEEALKDNEVSKTGKSLTPEVILKLEEDCSSKSKDLENEEKTCNIEKTTPIKKVASLENVSVADETTVSETEENTNIQKADETVLTENSPEVTKKVTNINAVSSVEFDKEPNDQKSPIANNTPSHKSPTNSPKETIKIPIVETPLMAEKPATLEKPSEEKTTPDQTPVIESPAHSPSEITKKCRPINSRTSSSRISNGKLANGEIVVESTLLDTSTTVSNKSLDESKFDLTNYPEGEEEKKDEDPIEKKTANKRGTAVEKEILAPRTTRRSTRSAMQPAKEHIKKPTRKETTRNSLVETEKSSSEVVQENGEEKPEEAVKKVLKKAGRPRRKTIAVAAESVENNGEKEPAEEEVEETVVAKKAEPAKRGRRKTVQVSTEDVEAAMEMKEALDEDKKSETADENEEETTVAKKEDPPKRGRKKTIKAPSPAKSETLDENKKSETADENEEETTVAKKEDPPKRGRKKTIKAPSPAESETLEDIAEEESSSKKSFKRGRRKTAVVNSEDISTALEAASTKESDIKEPTAESETNAPSKPTLGRRVSLRTRPQLISTPKETPQRKSKVKAIEEAFTESAKLPPKAKVTRRNSVAVTTAKKSPEKLKKSSRKSEATTAEENLSEEPIDEEETKPEATKKIGRGRRNTIAIVTPSETPSTAKKSAKSIKAAAAKQVDTYSYDESDKSTNESVTNKKTLKKKRNQAEISANATTLEETEKKKMRGKLNKSEHSESENEVEKSVPDKKKKAQKRKSIQEKVETLEATSTPKLFFHSKRVKTTTPTTTSTANASKTVYSPFINTPTKTVCQLNNSELDASASVTPNGKKFKLLKDLKSSSSSESSNNSEDEHEKDQITTDKHQSNNTSELKSSLATTSPETKKTPNQAKQVSIKLPATLPVPAKVNGNTDVLNKTIDNGESRPERPVKPKSTRISLGNIRSSNASPKIMTTGIMLTDKEKQIVKSLGGEVVTDVYECTHLITNKIRKTYKFLSCLGRNVFIVGDRWLEESNKAKMFLSPATYTLNDKNSEKQYKFSLQTSLLKSKMNFLFVGWSFTLNYEDSPTEELTYSNIKTIIECANGVVDESGKLPTDSALLAKHCIIYESKEKFAEDKANASVKVAKILLDTLLTCVLKQSFDSSSFIEHPAE